VEVYDTCEIQVTPQVGRVKSKTIASTSTLYHHSMAKNGQQQRRQGNRRAKQPRARGVGNGLQQTTFNPPTIVTSPPQRLCLRFQSAGTALRVTRGCLLSLAVASLANATNSGQVIPSFTGVRINKITLWQNTTAIGANPKSVDLTWLSDLGQDIRLTRSYLAGPAAALITRPPRGSRAAMWSRADSLAATIDEILFVVNADGATPALLDLDLSVTRGDVEVIGSTVAGGGAVISFTGAPVVGPYTTDNGLFYTPLDNLSPANTVGTWQWLPVGVTPIFTTAPTTWTRTES